MNDLISIIVPVYNVEKYIDRCVKSIIKQKYENIEIILVNDGSTDNSGYLCDKWKDIDKRIQVIHKKNGGLSDARNAGLNICSGKFVGFVDSDDWIDSNMYQEMYKLIKQYKSDICMCRIEKTENTRKIITREFNYTKEPYLFNKEEALEELFKDKIDVSSCSKLYNVELFKETQFPFGKTNEDFAILYKLFLKSQKIVYTKQVFYYYIERENSITTSVFNKQQFDKYYNCLSMLEYIKNNAPSMLSLAKHYTWYQGFCLLKTLYLNKLDGLYIKECKSLQKMLTRNILNILFSRNLSFKEKAMYLSIGFIPKIYIKKHLNKD